jgi:hypothetical protein
VQIGRVEGRIFSDEDRVELRQIHDAALAQTHVRCGVAHGHRAYLCEHLAALVVDLHRQAMQALMTARDCSTNESKARVFVENHRFCGIHYEQQAHGTFLCTREAAS